MYGSMGRVDLACQPPYVVRRHILVEKGTDCLGGSLCRQIRRNTSYKIH